MTQLRILTVKKNYDTIKAIKIELKKIPVTF